MIVWKNIDPVLTTARNADETAHPRKIIVPIDIACAELEAALGNAGFALLGTGEYVRLRRIPELIRKRSKAENQRSKAEAENWYRERQRDWLDGM
jgi:hypothetical protein